MKRFLITFAAVVAAQLFLAFVAFLGAFAVMSAAVLDASGKLADVPAEAFLVQEVRGETPEYVPPTRLPMRKHALCHSEILENLEKARIDDRIRGVILKIDLPQVGWGKLRELRGRVQQLRDSGKPVYAYTSFATNKALYLAAACDSIYVHPRGLLFLSGLSAERLYARRLLDQLDIETQVSQIKEYKSMAEMVMREDMSPEVRENMRWVLEDLYENLLNTLARDRAVDRAHVDAWFDACQFDAAEAEELGIVDRVLFWEELENSLRPAGMGEWFVGGRDYARVTRGKLGLRGQKIAVVHGMGTITVGESGWAAPMGITMGDETMVAALREALEDEAVVGVLLRLDTGGGLSSASDRIGRMVAEVAREKPVVVSMVDLTASGGYMVSYRCGTLVALPTSIVGSIGSISMQANLAGLLAKLGITVDRVTVGPHATFLSGFASLSPDEFARFDEVHWRGYDSWVADVARHRGMTPEEVDRLARGRVFTGRQALANGLIDELGGFDEALALLKEQAGIDSGSEVSYIHLPREKNLLERIAAGDMIQVLADLSDPDQSAAALRGTTRFWKRCLEGDDALAMTWWRL